MLCSHDELNQILLFNIDSKHLTHLVNTNHAICCHVADRYKDELISDSLAVDEGSAGSFEHEEVTELGDYENYTIFGRNLHEHGEVTDSIGCHLNLGAYFKFRLSWRGSSDFHNVQAIDCLVCLLFTECKEIVLEGGD